ncbi:MAG: terminase small subunit [Clostridiales bacterium]|nr:terminase small subunit [Clostridiales bacterium]
MKNELNEKQKMFCLEYLKDFNATRAYREVY